MENHRDDPSTYKPLTRGPLSGSKKRVTATVNSLDGKLPMSTLKVLKPNNTKLEEIYGLVKTHKKDKFNPKRQKKNRPKKS